MKLLLAATAAAVIAIASPECHADCSCDDWVEKEGYCVDYIKQKIPSFQIPQSTAEIATQKNRDIPEIAEGDVAMFNFSNYWHVAYVENVHLNRQGTATAIDVSEMNFGGQLSFDEYQNRWGKRSESEWKRALCCGITENYGQLSSRKNIPLNTVKQVWSPDEADGGDRKFAEVVADKAKEVINRFYQLAEQYL